jgi:hypothetical protein
MKNATLPVNPSELHPRTSPCLSADVEKVSAWRTALLKRRRKVARPSCQTEAKEKTRKGAACPSAGRRERARVLQKSIFSAPELLSKRRELCNSCSS